jgi:hypothetical protein
MNLRRRRLAVEKLDLVGQLEINGLINLFEG